MVSVVQIGSLEWVRYGSGSGRPSDEIILKDYYSACAEDGTLKAEMCLKEASAEVKRIMIECLGPDRLFREIKATEIHRDIDGLGNPRRLIRIPMRETTAGYIQAVHVICPSTKREYYLGVKPNVKTCQEAVSSTFGIKSDEYILERES